MFFLQGNLQQTYWLRINPWAVNQKVPQCMCPHHSRFPKLLSNQRIKWSGHLRTIILTTMTWDDNRTMPSSSSKSLHGIFIHLPPWKSQKITRSGPAYINWYKLQIFHPTQLGPFSKHTTPTNPKLPSPTFIAPSPRGYWLEVKPIPFRSKQAQAYAEHTSLLGSTNPCPVVAHMEPFSTSAFKVLIWQPLVRILVVVANIDLRLPPRSAPEADSLRLTPKAASQPLRPPTWGCSRSSPAGRAMAHKVAKRTNMKVPCSEQSWIHKRRG